MSRAAKRRNAKRPHAGQDLECFARCAGGFEATLAQELKDLQLHRVRPLQGGVAFFGSLEDAYRACLWSRIATRIQLVLARVSARDAQALYAEVANVDWERHIREGTTIAVEAHGTNQQLRNTEYTALKVKDALCDRLRLKRGKRPDVNTRHPDVSIDVAVHEQRATLYLNISGASLHRRGYREDGVQTEAPLKETLAAGMLLAAGWPRIAQEGGLLVDPMCGSGTFAIEAALMATNTAPGLLRDRWGFEGWAQHDAKTWQALVEQAHGAVIDKRRPQGQPLVVAGDLDPAAVQIARDNALRAGMDSAIWFHVDNASNLARYLRRAHAGSPQASGLLVANPPYGQRLMQMEDLPQAYAALARAIDGLPKGWQAAILTPDAGIDSALGRLPWHVLACHNGPIATWIRQYDAQTPKRTLTVTSLAGTQHTVPYADDNTKQLAARLRKRAKERASWSNEQHLGSYRVYDADLPDFASCIDVYDGDAIEGVFVRIEEYRRPPSVDEQRAARRLADTALLVGALYDLPSSQVLIVPYLRTKPNAKAHRNTTHAPMRATLREGDLHATVDLVRPGEHMPLEQRGMRQLVGTLSQGKSVAGLFAQGSAALVTAAHGGATQLMAVDGSQERLDWVRETLRSNDISLKHLRCARMDVRAWVAQEAGKRRTYDLLLCLAPEWLPAKEAGGTTWDLRRDYAALLRAAIPLLASGGTMLFAYDAPGIQLDLTSAELPDLTVQDVSETIVPADFARARTHPHCFVLRARE